MPLAAQLYDEHRQILSLLDALYVMVSGQEEPVAHEVARSRWKIASAVGRHMGAEQGILASPLLDATDPATRPLAQEYRERYRAMQRALAEHNVRWTAAAAKLDRPSYAKALRSQITGMRHYMRWEEENVYPLVHEAQRVVPLRRSA